MKPQSKLQHQHQEQQHSAEQQQESLEKSALEFATPEELLRHDASHTPVPPGIARRLQDSARKVPTKDPWWRRWLKS